MAWPKEFERAFHPGAVAVVGASTQVQWPGGTAFIATLQHLGFPGRIYPVNPKASEIRGLKAYPSVQSIPEPVDLVMVSVPSKAVPTVLEDCIAAGARNIHIFTSGFDEIGTEEGRALSRKVLEIARRGNLHILGPNCMGLHVPAARLSTWEIRQAPSGPVAFVSQSGGHTGQFVGSAPIFGITISKAISFGNALLMDSTDLLEYLATDPETKIIAMYLEGVRDGTKLTQMVKEINPTKPVLVWKGGLTESGARAVSSHTGSLGGAEATWEAFYRQTGAVRADSLEELLDVIMCLLNLKPPRGRRVALMGAGGGNSVAGADVCARAGLQMPVLTPETQRVLRQFIPPEGTSIRNPLDIGLVLQDIGLLQRALEPVIADPVIDAVLFALPIGLLAGMARGRKVSPEEAEEIANRHFENILSYLKDFRKERAQGKALLIVLQVWGITGVSPGQRARFRNRLVEEGFPTFNALERAAAAYSKFVGYHEFQRQAGKA